MPQQDNTTRRQRDQRRAFTNGYDAGAKYGDAAVCHYNRPWLRAGWRAGWKAAQKLRRRS